jgi:ribosomal protein S27AE
MTATEFATDDSMVHLALPCPACEGPVDVVVDTVRHQARWACVRCQLLGFAPFVLDTQGPAPGATRPVPSA